MNTNANTKQNPKTKVQQAEKKAKATQTQPSKTNDKSLRKEVLADVEELEKIITESIDEHSRSIENLHQKIAAMPLVRRVCAVSLSSSINRASVVWENRASYLTNSSMADSGSGRNQRTTWLS